MHALRVRVPATSANLGPGFDCLGVALALYNEFTFSAAESYSCTVTSGVSKSDALQVSTDTSNLAWRAFGYLFHQYGEPVPLVDLAIEMNVPLGRGLGSSATAIVAGVAAANAWLGSPLKRPQWLEVAARIEGHPDNVTPAALGGCQLALLGDSGTLITCPIKWHDSLVPVLAVPDFALATSKARAVLPKSVPHADAVFNASHLALLIRAIESGDGQWLTEALQDRLHQPYRSELIPGWQQVREAARAAGAWEVVISGAGPSLLALCPVSAAQAVRQAIADVWPGATILLPGLDREGSQLGDPATFAL